MLTFDEMMDPERGRAAGEAALAARRARGETMVYIQDGWVVVEYGGGRIERICPQEEFRAEMVSGKIGYRQAKQMPAAE